MLRSAPKAALLGLLAFAVALTMPALSPAAPPAEPTAAVRRTIDDLIDEASTLEDGARTVAEDERVALLGRAATVLERALSLDPRHVEARIALAKVLGDESLGKPSLARGVQELYRARTEDVAGTSDFEIAQSLGVALSRQGRFAEAVAEYDRALRVLPGVPASPGLQRSFKSQVLGNSAEALMALGRLSDAIARYGQAEVLETTDSAALHSLGLAVAYDRDGQLEKSRDALLRSLTTDPAMRLFQSDMVFFVPAGDRHYYVALAAEAFGDREKAMESWQRFLRELPQSRYAQRARQHLDALRRTPGLTEKELARAEVTIGDPLFPPERPLSVLGRRSSLLPPRLRNEDDILRIAQEHRPELRQCYARALRRDGRLSGDLEIALVLDRSGAVAMAEVLRGNFGRDLSAASDRDAQAPAAQELIQCAQTAMRRWRFSVSDADHEELALPLHFEARRP